MLNKRIASILVAGMVMVSMVGCQSTKGHVEYIDNRQNPIESQYEGEDSKQGKEEKDLTVKEKREVEKAKEAAKEVKKQGKAKDESTRKPRYWLGVYIGDFTDSEVEAMNKKISDEIDKAIQEQFKDDNTNSDVDERNNYKPADNNYDEDYWKTDGDIPEEEQPEEQQPEEQPTFNEDNTVHWIDETNGTDEYISNDEAQERMDNINKQNEQIEQQIQQSNQSNIESEQVEE